MVIKKSKDKNENLTVTTEEEPSEIHESNEEIAKRKYIFPTLAEGIEKLGRKYPDDQRKALESEWTNFKTKTDFSIPVKKIITSIIRIRTMSNPDQALGEYVYYMANLIGYQKQFVEGKVQTVPAAEVSDVPFGMDIQKVLQPVFKNGVNAGYEDKGEFRFYTEKFTPEGIDTLLDNSTPQEGIAVTYTVIDTSSSYGGFTKEELQKCKLNRLLYRNTNKLNGTEILDQDKLK